jgi:hypothetical protein
MRRLSSGEAGEVLDKLRRFRVRLAVVCPPGSVGFSSRFREILSNDLRVFESREEATRWLSRFSVKDETGPAGDEVS